MKQPITVYVPVSPELRLPETDGHYFCNVSHGSIARSSGNKQVCILERGRFYQVGDSWSFVEEFLEPQELITFTEQEFKQAIIDACNAGAWELKSGEQYYNETFNRPGSGNPA